MELYCNGCNTKLLEGELFTSECGDEYCESCYDENFFSCERCGNEASVDDYHDGECYECYSARDCEDGNVEEIEREYINVISGKDTFGVEIEAERGDYSNLVNRLPKIAGIKGDGSLNENGVEVVTPPMTFELLEDYIPKICTALKESDFEATQSCGLHVHIKPELSLLKDIRKNKKKLTKAQREVEYLKTLFQIMEVVEPAIFSMLPASRINGRWCQSIKNRPDNLGKKMIEKKVNQKSTFYKFLDSRYYGINFFALQKYGTIEFRYHSGTIDDEKILNWIKLIARICEVAKWVTVKKFSTGRFGKNDYMIAKKTLLRIAEQPSRLQKAREVFSFFDLHDSYYMERVKKFHRSHRDYRISGIRLLNQNICVE